jgi:excisionase family DNA binding protein
MDSNEILTMEQVVEKLKCSDRYVRDAISDGELRAYKRGHRYYIFYEDLIAFIKGGKDSFKVKEKGENE